MRWFGLLGVAVLCGCARENPAFDPDQSTTGASGMVTGGIAGSVSSAGSMDTLASESAEATTAVALDIGSDESSTTEASFDTTGGYGDDFACGADQLNIRAAPTIGECMEAQGTEVVLRGQCAQVFAGDEGGIRAYPADGCGTNLCDASEDSPLNLNAEYVPLDAVLGPSDEPVCMRYDLYGFATGRGDCWWNALILWSNAGELEIAVGNGIPSEGDVEDVEQPEAGNVSFISEIDIPATCGDGQGCDRSGWRKLRFGNGEEWAVANGVPAHSSLGEQDLLMFNWGLNIDLACERYGHWGVVPEGDEWIFNEP